MKTQDNDFVHKFIGNYRTEKVPVHVKNYGRVVKQTTNKVFVKAESVFADWKEPVKANYDKILAYDSALWKVPRFVRDDPATIKELS